MKNVILNGLITDLNGNVVSANNGRRVYNPETQEYQEQAEALRFGGIVYRKLISSRTKTDEDTQMLFALAEKVNNTLKVAEPETISLSDEEFAAVKRAIDSEALIVKARFLQMVEELNTIIE